MKNTALQRPQPVRWDHGTLYLLDQTRLPLETVIDPYTTVEQVWDAIRRLKVRGAPAIGIAGAYGLVLAMRSQQHLTHEDFLAQLDTQAAYLDSARPTAVNLHWALQRLLRQARQLHQQPVPEIYQALEQTAIQIHAEDRQLCRRIGDHGRPLIKTGMGILTHCNAGALATAELGTALAPLYLAHEAGVSFRVYADETRPLLQGARLTTWELQQAGIDVTLICDNMAATLMAQDCIDMVIVGTDRVAANGDVANKIGTLGVAILAQYFQIPFYVACPLLHHRLRHPSGEAIVIEERAQDEVTHLGQRRTAPVGMAVRNPAFDVTPHTLVGADHRARNLAASYGETLRAGLWPRSSRRLNQRFDASY
ncbi:Methylthioribose-1-phosphate isomerase 1 [Halomicronema hongdechloris C2206]|uniref:Methylthioribose-1-phosphate isomerase n=1 Tax=Halomicronema hongdechloris C2206 TaxID=1641165 RepID=A0A1Z3HMK1_9CYAN|nr:S-methyl-5-thioribose-1-phosphate isomerase [Halomicronema hongdechloris]ASC71542.1 Methylthioribose-1-phosphate isomerase 1 [Halomicronema hongdechloris C2206]